MGFAAGAVTVTVLLGTGAVVWALLVVVGLFHRFPLGVATARIARDATERAMGRRANMTVDGVGKAWESWRRLGCERELERRLLVGENSSEQDVLYTLATAGGEVPMSELVEHEGT